MDFRYSKISFFSLIGLFFLSGCATAPSRRVDPQAELTNQIVALQSQLQAKDQQIQDLEAQLGSIHRSLPDTSLGGKSAAKSKYILVPGVSVLDVQRTLQRKGLDPGPMDGQMGKRAKKAIKEFQRRNNLNADGIVGEKTWALLK